MDEDELISEVSSLHHTIATDLREQRDWLRTEMLRRDDAVRVDRRETREAVLRQQRDLHEAHLREDRRREDLWESLVSMVSAAVSTIGPIAIQALREEPVFEIPDEDPEALDPDDYRDEHEPPRRDREPTVTPTPAERLGLSPELLQEGIDSFGTVVGVWLQNWNVKEAPQPDRQGVLLASWIGHGKVVNAYIREQGGLVGAVHDRLLALSIQHENLLEFAKTIAMEIVAVATATGGLPLDRLLERSMFEDPTKPPSGGLACDTIDFTRPKYVPQMVVG